MRPNAVAGLGKKYYPNGWQVYGVRGPKGHFKECFRKASALSPTTLSTRQPATAWPRFVDDNSAVCPLPTAQANDHSGARQVKQLFSLTGIHCQGMTLPR